MARTLSETHITEPERNAASSNMGEVFSTPLPPECWIEGWRQPRNAFRTFGPALCFRDQPSLVQ